MTETKPTSVCIVGAGSMGVITGYHLQLAGAAVTFLVRPHRREQLSRPQALYSFDDQSLKTFSGYDLLTDPAELAGTSFDFVVITLDSASLHADAGLKLVDEIGRAFRDTPTRVILGSAGIDLRTWFLERSGLAETQVTGGTLALLAYEAQKVTLPLHNMAQPEQLAGADYGYRHVFPFGFGVELSAPQVAHDFAELYNRSGVSQCNISSADEYKVQFAVFPVIVAWELLDWPAAANIAPTDKTWQLGIESMREIQRLSVFGPAGLAASEQTDAEAVLKSWQEMEKNCLPLDLAEFNRYHHGGKVNEQDHKILRDALKRGEAEGAKMPALRALVAQLPSESAQS